MGDAAPVPRDRGQNAAVRGRLCESPARQKRKRRYQKLSLVFACAEIAERSKVMCAKCARGFSTPRVAKILRPFSLRSTMAVTARLATTITCHAWSPDRTSASRRARSVSRAAAAVRACASAMASHRARSLTPVHAACASPPHPFLLFQCSPSARTLRKCGSTRGSPIPTRRTGSASGCSSRCVSRPLFPAVIDDRESSIAMVDGTLL
jgi:hypothetical protein